MITASNIRIRFPEYTLASNEKIEMFIQDAVVEMGSDTSRWIDANFYNLAQSYLVGHLIAIAGGVTKGDSTPALPISKTDVDGALVEFDTSSLSKFGGATEFMSTSYGQRFVRYRRMAFAGGRIAM